MLGIGSVPHGPHTHHALGAASGVSLLLPSLSQGRRVSPGLSVMTTEDLVWPHFILGTHAAGKNLFSSVMENS